MRPHSRQEGTIGKVICLTWSKVLRYLLPLQARNWPNMIVNLFLILFCGAIAGVLTGAAYLPVAFIPGTLQMQVVSGLLCRGVSFHGVSGVMVLSGTLQALSVHSPRGCPSLPYGVKL